MEPNVDTAQEVKSLDEAGIKKLLGEVLRESGMDAVLATLKTLEKANSEAHAAITSPAPVREFSPDEKLAKGEKVAQFIRALGFSRLSAGSGRQVDALGAAKLLYGERHPVTAAIAKSFEPDVQRAVESATGSAGGFLIPADFSADFIELLRPASVVRAAGPTIIGMPRGTISVPGMAGGASASYIGEGTAAGKTQPSFRQVKATSKKLAAVLPISNDFLRRANPGSDRMIVDDAVAAVAQASDLAFLRSNGANGEPKGLRYWAGNTFDANATVNLANVTTDLNTLFLKLEESNCRMIRPALFAAPRTKRYMTSVRDGNGNLGFAELKEKGTHEGRPFLVSTQIPKNLGVGTNESELYLADMADVVIAEEEALLVDISTEAAYQDGASVVPSFSFDQTVVRIIALHDLIVRHAASVAVMTAVKWGA